MKQLLTLSLLFSLTAHSQTQNAWMVDTSKTRFFQMVIGDNGKIAATIYHNGTLVVHDSLQAIKKLIDIGMKCSRRQSRDYYAHEILRWVDTSGKVVNKKLFQNAVKEYMQIKEWE